MSCRSSTKKHLRQSPCQNNCRLPFQPRAIITRDPAQDITGTQPATVFLNIMGAFLNSY